MVFAIVADPVGTGFVESLARPGGRATGFMMFEYSLSSKWLEVLKEIAPSVTRVAVLRDICHDRGDRPIRRDPICGAVVGVGVEPDQRAQFIGEIERAVAAFARTTANGGLIVTASPLTTLHRDLIVALAARHRLPAVYPEQFVCNGRVG